MKQSLRSVTKRRIRASLREGASRRVARRVTVLVPRANVAVTRPRWSSSACARSPVLTVLNVSPRFVQMNSLRRDEFSVESPELSLPPSTVRHSRLASHVHVTFTNQFIQIQRFDVRRRVKYLGGAITLVERNHLRAIPQVIVRPKQLRRRRRARDHVSLRVLVRLLTRIASRRRATRRVTEANRLECASGSLVSRVPKTTVRARTSICAFFSAVSA